MLSKSKSSLKIVSIKRTQERTQKKNDKLKSKDHKEKAKNNRTEKEKEKEKESSPLIIWSSTFNVFFDYKVTEVDAKECGCDSVSYTKNKEVWRMVS